MARILSQSLARDCRPLTRSSSAAVLVGRRCRSGRPEKVELIEVDIEADPPTAAASESKVVGMRRLEDAIHGIIVRQSAPDWLPFVPGASYWVPPLRRPLGVLELVSRLANPMTEEELLSLTTVHGWPSSAYFVEGVSPHPVKRRLKETAAQTDDEDN